MSSGNVKITVDEILLMLLTYGAFIDNRWGNDNRPMFVKVHLSHDVAGVHN
jgi:hypothetical protein